MPINDDIKNILKNASQHGSTELNRINYLDGWRGLAISGVLISHFLPISGLNLGRMGVDIFFVLSGMLMSNILFVKRVPLATFYKKRISRIIPVFFTFLTLICSLSYIFNLSKEHENYIYLLTFMRSYFPESPHIWHTGLPIGHLWSLNVEEHSYIFLSLISLITFIKGKEFIPLLGIGIGIIILHYFYATHPEVAPENYSIRTEIVASHLLLSAGYFLIKDRFKPYICSWMPVATFFLAILCYSKDAPHWTPAWVFSPFLLAFTVNHLDSISDSLKEVLSCNFLRLLGVYSYSIYLWQQPFYYYGVKFKELFPFAGLVFLLLGCITGVISFYLIENPTRKYLNNNW